MARFQSWAAVRSNFTPVRRASFARGRGSLGSGVEFKAVLVISTHFAGADGPFFAALNSMPDPRAERMILPFKTVTRLVCLAILLEIGVLRASGAGNATTDRDRGQL